MRFFRSIYSRLGFILFVLLSVAGLGQLFFAVNSFREFSLRSEQQRNWGVATAIADRIQSLTYPRLQDDAINKHLIDFQQLNPEMRIAVLDSQGAALVTAPQDELWRLERVSPESLTPALDKIAPTLPQFAVTTILVDVGKTEQREVIFSVARLHLPQGPGYIFVEFDLFQGAPLERVGQFALARISVIGFLAVLSISLALGIIAFFAFTSRFRAATKMLQRFSHGDYAARLSDTSRDELGEMSQAINMLADSVVSAKNSLESRDQQRRNLIANITHDLRNPLTAMRSRLDGLSRQIKLNRTIPVDELAGEVQALVRNTELQQRLVHDLFELSKLEALQHIVFDDVSLSMAAEAVVQRMEPVVTDAELALELRIEPDVDYEVVADQALIERAIGNLVENAVRYSPAHSKIQIALSRSPEGLRISVRDAGAGVEPEVAANLFEPGTRDSSSPGAGLGLSIVKRIVEIHHGQLECESTEGIGTTFHLILPYPNQPG